MGYLDKQNRVVDVTLTEKGKKLFASGELDFAYFGLFDDCIDYDPYDPNEITDETRELIIESTPVLEAPSIPDVRGTTAALEPTDHIFTAAAGYVQLPKMIAPIDGTSLDLYSDQRNEGGSYRRTGTSLAQIDLDVIGDTEPGDPGFIIRVLSSGSNGLSKTTFKRDLAARRAIDPFIAVAIDDETINDRVFVRDPQTARVDTNSRKR